MDGRSKGNTLGQSFNKTPKATCRPGPLDIAWAAGLFEGEGTCAFPKTSQLVCISQKEVDILLQLQRLFGGQLSHSDGSLNALDGSIFHWKLYGARARGFLMTIYKFMSPKRKLQIQKVLKKGIFS